MKEGLPVHWVDFFVGIVYDQTVPRRHEDDPPVSTHAGVFLRLPAAGTANRKTAQKDYAGRLRDLFLAQNLDWQTYREAILQEINDKAAAGAFVLKAR